MSTLQRAELNPARIWIVLGAIFAALAVAAGAFGAHALEAAMENAEAGPKRLAAWKTAAQYQFFSALGLIALGLMPTKKTKSQFLGGILMVVGILVFSGVLYAYTLTYVKILGAIVPVGGVSMLAAWTCFAIAATGATRAWGDDTADEASN
jgi:uncharacterized membrane protein YgdD (TMEM256/DUF423 family)